MAKWRWAMYWLATPGGRKRIRSDVIELMVQNTNTGDSEGWIPIGCKVQKTDRRRKWTSRIPTLSRTLPELPVVGGGTCLPNWVSAAMVSLDKQTTSWPFRVRQRNHTNLAIVFGYLSSVDRCWKGSQLSREFKSLEQWWCVWLSTTFRHLVL